MSFTFMLDGGSGFPRSGPEKYPNNLLYTKFNYEVKSIVEFTNKFFKKIRIPKVQGVRIDTIDDFDATEKIEKPITGVFPAFRAVLHCNYQKYFILEPTEKINFIINILEDASYKICDLMSWNKSEFQSCFTEIKALNNSLIYTLGKPKQSPDRLHTAAILVRLYPEKTECYIEFKTKKSSEAIKYLVAVENNYFGATVGDELYGLRFLRGGAWLNNTQFQTYDDRDKVHYLIEITTGRIETIFTVDDDRYKQDFYKEYEAATTLDDESINKLFMPSIQNWERNGFTD